MKIAIIHDYFTQLGGAERVAEALMQMLPGATLHATVALPDHLPQGLQGAPLVTSWMQYLPLMRKYYRHYFLLYPLGVGSFNLANYDLVISSSSGYVKGVHARRDAMHICYCHTPMRWVWGFDNYSARESLGWGKRSLLALLVQGLKHWDVGASRQPDHFVANSRAVAARIFLAYGRHSEIIYPPIDVHRFRPSSEIDDYYLVLARLVSYKRIDLAVKACNLLGKRLLIIGDGPDRARLEAESGATISFLGRLSDRGVEHYAARCKALIFPGEEDFGMAPVEVAAAGRPTIAYRAGGALETVIDGSTGLFFDQQKPEALAAAIEIFEQKTWSSQVIRDHSEEFGVDAFQTRFRAFLERVGAPVNHPGAFPLAHEMHVQQSESVSSA